MGCKNNVLYNTGLRRSSEVIFLKEKLCILEEFPKFDRIFHKIEFEKPTLVWNAFYFPRHKRTRTLQIESKNL
jgi:hypothetical protein